MITVRVPATLMMVQHGGDLESSIGALQVTYADTNHIALTFVCGPQTLRLELTNVDGARVADTILANLHNPKEGNR